MPSCRIQGILLFLPFLDTFGCSEWYFPGIFLWLVFLRSSLRRHYYISNLIIFCERFSVHCWFAIILLHFSFTTCWLVDKLISVVIFNLRRACQGDVSLNLATVEINLKLKGEGTIQNGEHKMNCILNSKVPKVWQKDLHVLTIGKSSTKIRFNETVSYD